MFVCEFCFRGEWIVLPGPNSAPGLYANADKAHDALIDWRQEHGIPTIKTQTFLRVREVK